MSDLVPSPAIAAILQNRLNEAQTCHEMVLTLPQSSCLAVSSKEWAPGAIEIAHRAGRIQADAKEFSHELRQYRNLVVRTSSDLTDWVMVGRMRACLPRPPPCP
jgi:hypothetical protein